MTVRKKTYVTDLYHLNSKFAEYFEYLKEAVLPLISVNGILVSRDKAHAQKAKPFPNPATSKMLFQFYYKPELRTKFSATIVEYRDKQNKPILYLFPDGSTYSTTINPEKRLNSRQRRDLPYQKQLRINMLKSARIK